MLFTAAAAVLAVLAVADAPLPVAEAEVCGGGVGAASGCRGGSDARPLCAPASGLGDRPSAFEDTVAPALAAAAASAEAEGEVSAPDDVRDSARRGMSEPPEGRRAPEPSARTAAAVSAGGCA